MSTTTRPPAETDAYLDRVRAALGDLPPQERDELLADVEVSLLETASDSIEPLTAQLGPPEQFARELRAAAGLAPAAGATRRPGLAELRAWLVCRARSSRDLLPIWWALRGYAAFALIAWAAGAHFSHRLPLLPVVSSAALTLVLLALAAAASLALRDRAGRAGLVADLVLAAGLLPLALHVSDVSHPVAPVVVSYLPPTGLAYSGTAIDNVYPYDAAGRLLHDVRLYDGAGRALDVGTANAQIDPWRRFLRTRRGKIVLNAFPIRYFEPGTHHVAHPNAGPPLHVGKVRVR